MIRTDQVKLKLLPLDQYLGVNRDDPLRFYSWPIIGGMYRRRVELCLAECRGGDKVLEVGFGSGVSFLNLHDKYRVIYGLDLTAAAKHIEVFFQKLNIEANLTNGNVLEMPYTDDFFDTVLLISILEHLKPEEQERAFGEIRRVLKPGGQVVYGVPAERRLMTWTFRLMGVNIRNQHFSTEKDVYKAATRILIPIKLLKMESFLPFLGAVYEIGHFVKAEKPDRR